MKTPSYTMTEIIYLKMVNKRRPRKEAVIGVKDRLKLGASARDMARYAYQKRKQKKKTVSYLLNQAGIYNKLRYFIKYSYAPRRKRKSYEGIIHIAVWRGDHEDKEVPTL